mmetsp:Transcript_152821/g.292707  ORF Transcript_152821/g.292707 Transcript_152821/m.292707 type:complete len:82 (+) Transcript_152821:94-339(+)
MIEVNRTEPREPEASSLPGDEVLVKSMGSLTYQPVHAFSTFSRVRREADRSRTPTVRSLLRPGMFVWAARRGLPLRMCSVV